MWVLYICHRMFFDSLLTCVSPYAAERELDYSLEEVYVEFPAGSGVGHTQCGNVSISVDGLIEADESFSIRATVNSPSSVRFAGSYQQTAVVDVIIRDDDG